MKKINQWLSTVNKRLLSVVEATLLLMTAAFVFSGCADVNGLHNQKELLVTFQFSGFGSISGNYSIPGNFDGNQEWDNTNLDVVMKNGSGISSEISVTTADIQWSLVPQNDWTRPWYTAGVSEGNGADGSNGNRNFYIDGLDLNAGEATVIVKMENGKATPTVSY